MIDELLKQRTILITNLTKTSTLYVGYGEIKSWTTQEIDKIDKLIANLTDKKG